MTVGAQDVAVNLRLVNNSDGEYEDDQFQVSNLTLVPSCGSQMIVGDGDCPELFRDPDVFALSPTGTGRAGTACAGRTFTITEIDAAQGKYLFTPNTTFALGQQGTPAGECVVDFTVDVLRAPALDADGAEAGLQTDQFTFFDAESITPGGELGQEGSGEGSDETTVLQAAAAITTQVSDATVVVGESITDTATVTGTPNAPNPTGTVTFRFYAPADTTCQTPIQGATSTVALDGVAPFQATSAPFVPQTPGTYRVIATYNGDANYLAISGACGEANENVVVSPPPQIDVTKDVTPASQPLPTGEFTFTVQVGNPAGAPEALEITGLTDNVYGNIADPDGTGDRFRNSTCFH